MYTCSNNVAVGCLRSLYACAHEILSMILIEIHYNGLDPISDYRINLYIYLKNQTCNGPITIFPNRLNAIWCIQKLLSSLL